MIIIIKNIAGCDYPIRDVFGNIEKTISLKGGCFMNEISKDDFDLLCKSYSSFKNAIDEGFIIVNDSKNKAKEQLAVDDTLQASLDKQSKDIENNQKINKVKITKG